MTKNNLGGFLLAAVFLAAPAAALDFDQLPRVADIVREVGETRLAAPAVPEPAHAVPLKEWTIMVFMNGKNSLDKYVVKDLNEMEKAGPGPKMNIVVQAGRMVYTPPTYYPPEGYFDDITAPYPGGSNPYNPYGFPGFHYKDKAGAAASADWVGVRRYLVVGDGDKPEISSTLVQDLGQADMGDWRQLVDFARWAKNNYPAKKYMLVVWNHGSGWKRSPGAQKGISYDDVTGSHIGTVDLGKALREMGGVDLYASDACLMQMVEVAFELKDSAPVVVGSEENEPGDGWNYAGFLSRVHAVKGPLTPEALASAAVRGYKAAYSKYSSGVTQSAVRTSALPGFKDLLDQWVVLAMKEGKAGPAAALTETLAFGGSDSVDLLHFVGLAAGKSSSPALRAKSAEIKDFYLKNLLIENGVTGAKYEPASGLAVYLPSWGYDGNYGRLAWASAGKWDEFARWLSDKQ